MSNDFVTEIVGTGTYAIPSNDTELAAATSGLDSLISGVSNLTYERVLAWVEDSGGPGGAEGVRSLNCIIEQFTYQTEECPSEAQVDTMTGAIETALEADANITSIGRQNVSCFAATGTAPYWNRDSGGFLYPNTTTDDVAVGGATPNGKWFDDGDLVLGAAAMSSTEKLRVVGNARVEGKLTVTGLIDPTGLVLTEQATVPGGAPASGFGTLWVRNDTPNILMFTSDSPTDIVVTNWNKTGTAVHLLTSTDTVAVGASAMVGSEKLRVVGDVLVNADGSARGNVDLPVTNLTGTQGVYEIGGTPALRVYDNSVYVGGAGTLNRSSQDFNVAIGVGAFQLATASSDANVVIGYQACNLTGGTTGEVIAIGYRAAQNITSAEESVIIGYDAMQNATVNAANNVVIGGRACQTTSSTFNSSVIIGHEAGNSSGGITAGVFIGFQAGSNVTSNPASSVAVGYQSLFNILGTGGAGGDYNTCIGANSGRGLTTGSSNVFVGFDAGRVASANAQSNVGIGNNALETIATNSRWNVAVGNQALQNLGGAAVEGNVAVGTNAGSAATGAEYCVYIGYNAGQGNTTNSRLFIENSSDLTNPLIYGEFDGGGYLRVGGGFTVGAPKNAPPTGESVDAVYLDDGTNTVSGNPAWRYLVSTGPDVWSDIVGGGGSPWTSAAGVIYPATSTDDVAIGSTTMAGAERLYILDTDETGSIVGARARVEKDSTGTKAGWTGYIAEVQHTGAAPGTLYVGFASSNTYNNAAADIDDDLGFVANPTVTAVNSFDRLTGFFSQPTIAAGQTVTRYKGVSIDGISGAGDVTTSTGVDINDVGTTNSTTTYGIEIAAQTGTTARGIYCDDSIELTGTIVIGENADHTVAPAAGKGLLWVRSDSPNVLVFTDDAGTDTVLGAAGSSPWTSGAGLVYPSTLSDSVSIGVSAKFGTENLYIKETATGSGSYEGIRVEMEHTSGGAVTQFTGVTVALDQQAGAGGMNAFTSFDGTLAHQSATTFGTIKNYLASLTITDASGAVDDYYAFHAEVVGGSGTINNNAYGIYIGQMEQGGTTNAWGVYQASTADSNYFAGQTAFGTTSPLSSPRVYVEVDDGEAYTRGFEARFVKNSSSGTTSFTGITTSSRHTGNQASGTVVGFFSDTNFSPSASQTMSNMIGFESFPGAGTNSTITNVIGFRASNDEIDGAVTNWYGFKAEQPNTVGTGITNSYGIYIDDQDGNTLSYGVYQAAATDDNYFAGRVGINQTTVSSTNYLEIVDTDDSTTRVGVQVTVPKDGTGTNKTATGFDVNFTHSGTGSALAYYGHRSDVNVTAAATVGTVAGFYSDCINNGATAITNYFGVNVRSVVNSGTTTNAYGVYIQGMEATNRWGVYQTSSQDKNYFAGQVGIGTNAPDSACELEVADNTVSGQRRNIYVDYDMSGTASSLIWHGIEIDCDYTGTGGGTLRGISTEIIVNPSGTTTIPTIDCYYAVASLNNAALTVTSYACYRAGIGGSSATVANAYGLYIATMGLGTGNSWGVYQASSSDDNYFNGDVGIGNSTIDAAAKLQVDSTGKGFLPPRMTRTQRNAISSPPAGLVVYNTTDARIEFYNGSAWRHCDAGAATP